MLMYIHISRRIIPCIIVTYSIPFGGLVAYSPPGQIIGLPQPRRGFRQILIIIGLGLFRGLAVLPRRTRILSGASGFGDRCSVFTLFCRGSRIARAGTLRPVVAVYGYMQQLRRLVQLIVIVGQAVLKPYDVDYVRALEAATGSAGEVYPVASSYAGTLLSMTPAAA